MEVVVLEAAQDAWVTTVREVAAAVGRLEVDSCGDLRSAAIPHTNLDRAGRRRPLVPVNVDRLRLAAATVDRVKRVAHSLVGRSLAARNGRRFHQQLVLVRRW